MKPGHDESSHKDVRPSRIQRDEHDVGKLLQTIDTLMANPFDVTEDENVPLSNLATGNVLSDTDACRLLSVKQLGEEASNLFVNSRLQTDTVSVYEPVT